MQDDKTISAIGEQIRKIRETIAASACRAGRNPEDILLLAVTKTYPVACIEEAYRYGIRHFGENKVQDAKEKFYVFDELLTGATRHMIGHLQTNKVRQAVEIFDMIQSVDSLRLAAEIDKRSYTRDKIMDILIQVNTSREPSKYGVAVDDTVELVKRVSELKNIRIRGLMTIGALTASTAGDPEKVRPYFRKLAELSRFIAEQRIPNVSMDYLSMGMSLDYPAAIEEGANLIRIGTAIFGKRKRATRSVPMSQTEETK